MRKVILGILLGLSISTISVVAISLCNAKDIEYNSKDTTWDVDTVEDALNDLYEKNFEESNSCLNIQNFPMAFNYTGSYQKYYIACTGTYKIELWGAQGGNYNFGGNASNSPRSFIGGKGGYVSGNIYLSSSTILYLYIGGQGVANQLGGYNGGTNGDSYTSNTGYYAYPGGGGATDLRIWENSEDEYVIDSKEGINSRIMIAGGGGAAGWRGDGGDGGLTTNLSTSLYRGSNGSRGSGAGGGFFGGLSGGYDEPGYGGSSYVSGCDGCQSVTSIDDSALTNTPNHYSGKVFSDIVMTPGVNDGNGKVVITYLGKKLAEQE